MDEAPSHNGDGANELEIDDATYVGVRKSLEALTYNIQLLGGKPTADIAIAAEVRHPIDEMIEE